MIDRCCCSAIEFSLRYRLLPVSIVTTSIPSFLLRVNLEALYSAFEIAPRTLDLRGDPKSVLLPQRSDHASQHIDAPPHVPHIRFHKAASSFIGYKTLLFESSNGSALGDEVYELSSSPLRVLWFIPSDVFEIRDYVVCRFG